ncbi:hypothetical protein TGPRC2_297360 [Toxoplasma gondii TgCatPRC2]|uniref:Uncharacterized protein n=1 Tax=Toxoplasma gondii TgCatPRC2 TaxID=1130821 RepID=A0A151H226_TOXGO|nr:hypothetical protein TGPRC2_297360 [Toxoplasma gondii TgCatPRC2]
MTDNSLDGCDGASSESPLSTGWRDLAPLSQDPSFQVLLASCGERMIRGYNLISRTRESDRETIDKVRETVLSSAFADATRRVAVACVCPVRRRAFSELFRRSAEEESGASSSLVSPLRWCERVLCFVLSKHTASLNSSYLCAYSKVSQDLQWPETVTIARRVICNGEQGASDDVKQCFSACVLLLYTLTSRPGHPDVASWMRAFLSTPPGRDVYCFIGAAISGFVADVNGQKGLSPQEVSKTSRDDAGAVARLREARARKTFLRLVAVFDNLSHSDVLISRARSHQGLRTVRKAVVSVASRLLVHAAAIPVGISIRLWSIFSVYATRDPQDGASPRREKANTPHCRHYGKKNSQNLLSLTSASVRSQRHDVLELRAAVDCFRDALRSEEFLRHLRTELLPSGLDLLGTCISTAAELQKEGDDMALSVVAELLAYLVLSSAALRRHAVAQLNQCPTSVFSNENHGDESSADLETSEKRSKQLCKLSSAAVHFPSLLRACTSSYSETCIFVGAFLETCFVSSQQQGNKRDAGLGIHLPDEIKAEVLQALQKTVASPCAVPAVSNDADTETQKKDSIEESLAATQRRAACLSLLAVMAESASFASEVQQMLLDLLADTAKHGTADVSSLVAALSLAIDLSRCSSRLRESALCILRQDTPPVMGFLAQSVLSSTSLPTQRRLLRLVHKMLTEVLRQQRHCSATSRVPISALFLLENRQKQELALRAEASPSTPSKTFLGESSPRIDELRSHATSNRVSPATTPPREAPNDVWLSFKDGQHFVEADEAKSLCLGFDCDSILHGDEFPFHTRLLPIQPCESEQENVDLEAYAGELARVARLQHEQQQLLQDAATASRNREEEAKQLMKITVADLEHEKRKAEQKAETRQQELQRLQKSYAAELTRVRDEYETQTGQLRAMVNELQLLLESKEEKLKKAQDALVTSKQQQLSNDGECSKLQRQLQTLTTLNKKQKDDLSSVEAQCGSLREANDAAVKKLNEVSSKAKKLERQCTLLHAEKKDLIEEQERLFKQLILLLDHEQQLTAEQRRLRENVKENLEAVNRAEKLQQELDHLRREKENTGKEAGQMASRTATLQTEVAALKADLNKETEKRRAAEEAANTASEKTQNVSEELERMKKKLKSQAYVTEDLEKRLREKEEQLSKIQSIFCMKT